jgi:N-acetylglucosaminyldiphosphoundecaprenol N-acetyl-beta-D-mannosaminyltransferase
VNVSVIIPVRDRWQSLGDTLRSLAQQTHQAFEVIVVDDGSMCPPPESLQYSLTRCPLRIIRQSAMGIAAARNSGIGIARGEMILFTDSDCVLEPNCILEVVRCAADNQESVAFQLAFVPARDRLVWRVDGVGKNAKQKAVCTSSGHIKSLDTAGFAIRRTYVETTSPLFDVTHIRGEDTALLTTLIANGHLPRFVAGAHVEHRPVQGIVTYLFRHFQAGYRSAPARAQLRASSNALLDNRGRSDVLRTACATARNYQMGVVSIIFVLLACYLFELCGRLLYAIMGMRPGRIELLGLPLNCLHSAELQSLVLSTAESRKPSCMTYLTVWSLVQAQSHPQFKSALGRFNTIYADGMGVCLAAFLLHFRRVKKVTVNDFFMAVCREIARRNLGIALVGGTPAVIALTRERLLAEVQSLRVVLSSSGYMNGPQIEGLLNEISRLQPHLVVLAMGQPLQEMVALRIREYFPRCTILCVGGLFDYIAGINSTPPKFVRHSGFEWLWRFVHSPRRTWKRYLIGSPMLFGYVLREYMLRLWAMGLGAAGKTRVCNSNSHSKI